MSLEMEDTLNTAASDHGTGMLARLTKKRSASSVSKDKGSIVMIGLRTVPVTRRWTRRLDRYVLASMRRAMGTGPTAGIRNPKRRTKAGLKPKFPELAV